MFVYYFVHIDRPLEEVEGILPKLLDGMAEAADIAYREGERLLSKVGPGGPVAKSVHLRVGSPARRGETTAFPLAWEATGTPGLFPRMEAEIVLAPLGPRLTRVTFEGSYSPPLGAVGRGLDRVLLHRVAEATVKHLVDRIGSALVGWPRGGDRVEAPEPSVAGPA